MHHERASAITTRKRTASLVIPLARAFPPGTRWYVNRFDELQRWLIRDHAIGKRRREHEVFHALRSALLPRERLLQAEWSEENRVLADVSVGVAGWILARAYVIDVVGLNDYVIARNPALREATAGAASRRMAHARQPPEGYVECFRPNLHIGKRASRFTPGFEWRKPPRQLTLDELRELREETITIEPRRSPLTSQEIQTCDRSWRRHITR
jgi:arabinofuranosyltransferase